MASEVQNLEFLAAINHNYNNHQHTLKERNKKNGLKSINHYPQMQPFEPIEINV